MDVGAVLPVFRTKKEPFEWLKTGKKFIDVRKGNLIHGHIAVYLSGTNVLRMKIIKTESGQMKEVIRPDNYKLVVPSAVVLEDAFAYLRGIYADCDGLFTAYYVVPLE